jgi:hypothetical protein
MRTSAAAITAIVFSYQVATILWLHRVNVLRASSTDGHAQRELIILCMALYYIHIII